MLGKLITFTVSQGFRVAGVLADTAIAVQELRRRSW